MFAQTDAVALESSTRACRRSMSRSKRTDSSRTKPIQSRAESRRRRRRISGRSIGSESGGEIPRVHLAVDIVAAADLDAGQLTREVVSEMLEGDIHAVEHVGPREIAVELHVDAKVCAPGVCPSALERATERLRGDAYDDELARQMHPAVRGQQQCIDRIEVRVGLTEGPVGQPLERIPRAQDRLHVGTAWGARSERTP